MTGSNDVNLEEFFEDFCGVRYKFCAARLNQLILDGEFHSFGVPKSQPNNSPQFIVPLRALNLSANLLTS